MYVYVQRARKFEGLEFCGHLADSNFAAAHDDFNNYTVS